MRMRLQRKERAFWMAIVLSFSSTKQLASTDGDEVSGEFFITSPVAIYFSVVIYEVIVV